MPIRLIAIDLDGTLLNSRSEVSPANQQALVSAGARGAEVVIVTGRRAHSAHKYLGQIPCPVTLISSNGALISSPSGEVLHRNFLPCQVARQVLETAGEFRPYAAALFNIPGRGQILLQGNAAPKGPLGWYLAQSADCIEQVPDLPAALTTDPIQILFGGPPTVIEPIETLLRAAPVARAIQLSWTRYPARNVCLLDVMTLGCTKGSALSYWARQRGIDPSEVLAIGDNFNDLEMLQFAGHPVLMANSSPGLERDGWPLTLSNDEDGVAAAIQTYVVS
jgi:Cof subfamily protein (haloacid dehalogenase superfamily)